MHGLALLADVACCLGLYSCWLMGSGCVCEKSFVEESAEDAWGSLKIPVAISASLLLETFGSIEPNVASWERVHVTQ